VYEFNIYRCTNRELHLKKKARTRAQANVKKLTLEICIKIKVIPLNGDISI